MDFKKAAHLIYRFRAKPSGLLPTPEDKRDFQTGIFNWFGYTPKHTRHVIPTLSIKHQLFNCCQWVASITQKEPDEKQLLNVRLMVAKGKRMGLVSGDGFSNLRSGQKVLNEWGACPRATITEDASTWNLYSNVNPDLYQERASKHKTGSFWSVSSRNDAIKLLDEGRILTTGIMWYTGFNQGGGFSSPWIISKAVGYQVGGHAFIIKGYDMDKGLYICQNSYGSNWGDKGDFYITFDYMDRANYGYWVNLDEVDKDLGKFLMEYDGKNVKGTGPAIYHIQGGKKKPYPNWESFLAWNGHIRGFSIVDDELLNKVEKGEIMDITKTDYWVFLKNVQEADRLPALLEKLYEL
jgi:hypothetical protein